jgi:predicted nucleic acid binding AN1-type Zn finger protein
MYNRVHRVRLPRRCKIVLSTPSRNHHIYFDDGTLVNQVDNCRHAKSELNYFRTVIPSYENRRPLTSPNPTDFTREL